MAMMAAVLGLMAAGCVSTSRPPLGQGHDFGRNNPKVCVAIGDSITRGGKVTYPALLSRMIGKWVINLGVSGDHSIDGVRMVDRCLATYRPGYLLILFGANDVLHERSCDAYIENLRYMIRAAKRNRTIPILATMTPMIGSHRLYAPGVTNYNVKVRELARAEGVSLCDLELHFMAAGVTWGALMQTDGLHPNDEGLRLIAQSFRDLMR